MNTDAEYIRSKWTACTYDTGTLKLDLKHALDWNVGYMQASRVLAAFSDIESKNFTSSESIEILSGFNKTLGKYELLFILRNNSIEDVFYSFCADIISYSQKSESESESINLVYERYQQWNKLLKYKKCLMDEKSQKGLFGELIFLEDTIKRGYSLFEAVDGWTGPEGCAQDFIYSDGWHEIKSVHEKASEIIITSLEQLNNSDIGEIVVFRIEKCSSEACQAKSLSEQICAVKMLLRHDFAALELFEEKLIKYGYIDMPAYDKQKFLYLRRDRFRVSNNFPRLTADSVDRCIVKAQYSISLAGIEQWRIKD